MLITLEDGSEIEVRRLGIFELDNLMPDPVGPFTYKMKTLTGKEYDVEFDPNTYDEPPQKPDKAEHEVEENSSEWYQLLDWQLYQASIAHNHRRVEAMDEYNELVARYIINSCVKPEDVNRIVTEEDWERVYSAALVPQLTVELLEKTLGKTYEATFDGQSIFKALEGLDKGHSSYNTIRLWENKLMIEMSLTEVQYAIIPVEERARKVCALFLEPAVSQLEMNLADKNRDKNENQSPR